MGKHKIFLSIIGILALIAFCIGLSQTASGNFSGVATPFVWMGIFIWGDGIVLGAFLFLGSIFLWYKRNPVLTGMFFSGYAMLRSFIEIIYNLNEQFTTTARPWDSFVPAIAARFHLSMTEFFVLPQIFYTAVCLVAGLVFISYAKRYWKAV